MRRVWGWGPYVVLFDAFLLWCIDHEKAALYLVIWAVFWRWVREDHPRYCQECDEINQRMVNALAVGVARLRCDVYLKDRSPHTVLRTICK